MIGIMALAALSSAVPAVAEAEDMAVGWRPISSVPESVIGRANPVENVSVLNPSINKDAVSASDDSRLFSGGDLPAKPHRLVNRSACWDRRVGRGVEGRNNQRRFMGAIQYVYLSPMNDIVRGRLPRVPNEDCSAWDIDQSGERRLYFGPIKHVDRVHEDVSAQLAARQAPAGKVLSDAEGRQNDRQNDQGGIERSHRVGPPVGPIRGIFPLFVTLGCLAAGCGLLLGGLALWERKARVCASLLFLSAAGITCLGYLGVTSGLWAYALR